MLVRFNCLLQPITLDIVKKSFAIYGSMEKIEIFTDNCSQTQFAHVTFKDSRTAYLALIDCKQHPIRNVELIRPADVYQQPDNPIDSSMSSFYSLPDKCLLVIFRYCDVNSLATLSVVCKKMCQLLRDRVFINKYKFDALTMRKTDVMNALLTVGRLVQCIHPETFHINICRSFCSIKEWPSIGVDFGRSEQNQLSVDVSFLKPEWLYALEPVVKLVNAVCIQRTVYDKWRQNLVCEKLLWPNVTLLIMKGFSSKKSVPDFKSVIVAMPKLETILMQSLLFKMELKSLYTTHLKQIYFQNCAFKLDISKKQIVEMANIVKVKGTTCPLRMIFDRIQYLRQQHISYPIQFDGYDDEPESDDEEENADDYGYQQFKEPEYISIILESNYSETMMVCKRLIFERGAFLKEITRI